MGLKPNIKSVIDRAKTDNRSIDPVPEIGLTSSDVQELAEELQTEINENTNGIACNTVETNLGLRWLNAIQ